MESNNLSLYHLNQKIRDILFETFPVTLWVVAEISDIRFNRSGHCYLELIEKDEDTDKIIAKSRANIWASTCRILKPYFEMTTGQKLSAGLKILVNVTVEFHELYGSSLNIKDIDPAYTIGDLAQKRREILAQLENDGIIDMNKELQLPDLPQNIAIISSDTAAGYGDFIDQLINNRHEFKFYTKLFPAIMQGAQAETSIMQAFDRIFNYESFFDAVVLIRGGGSKADLSCFDSYELSYYITQFPLPVISGIGHDRDESIVDLVTHTQMKTPTAVAEFLINMVDDFNNNLLNLEADFIAVVKEKLNEETSRLEQMALIFAPTVNRIIEKNNYKLQLLGNRFKSEIDSFVSLQKMYLHDVASEQQYKIAKQFLILQQGLDTYNRQLVNRKKQFFIGKNHELAIFENSNNLLNPERILKRGYSITINDGKIIKSVKALKKGDIIINKLSDGEVSGKVTGLKKNV